MDELQKTENKIFSLVPQTYEQAIMVADRWAKSGVVPKQYLGNANAILVAWDFGGSLGLGLMQSLTSIAVINGLPSIWGDAMLALVMSSGELEDIEETGDIKTAKCIVKRKGRKSITQTFTIEDAKLADLLGKDNWKKYPKRMLQLRARSFALRDAFPDIIKGLYTVEEAQDLSDKFPDAIDTKSAVAPIKNVLAEPIKPIETVTDQETGEVTEVVTLTTDEMNEALALMDEITNLREQKDYILKEIAKDNPQKLNNMDEVIKGGFKGLSLSKIKEQRDFLFNLV
jgi:hypothetical protein